MYIHTSDPIIMNNLIYDNYIEPATGHGSGGAVFFYSSNAKLINNRITSYNVCYTKLLRTLESGHITASAWLLNKDETKALLYRLCIPKLP